MDLQKYCDPKTMSGYGSQLLYKDATETLYHILLPLESAPSVFGSVDTFDYDLLTCKTKGKVEGKETLDQKDVEFMWHRDNVRRLEELQGKVLDFMVVYQDFTARTFSGTIKVRPNDAGADIMRGTFTITPNTASTVTLLDCRDLIQDTVVFANTIPDSLVIGATAQSVEVATDPAKTASTIEAICDNTNFTVNVTPATESANAKVTIAKASEAVAGKQYGIVTITAKAEGYASWTTSIAVEY